ncbi:MAG: undecaprenyl/decaprenyl-phosphate alpha-N-acetylglucosaminyl 1-phosphate transferase [Alistipes sp.]|nr:undecaprenyl/decaprenyl-phosphate alpha-N-acetylglucosaminyl 1-phosphate transferase [Alistipes sp.]
MSLFLHLILPFCVAFLMVLCAYPKVLKVAQMKGIVDNPDARKLQKRPVPVLGGVAVFFGLTFGFIMAMVVTDCSSLFPVFVAMTVMLCVGTLDDIVDLSPLLRFAVEVVVVTAMVLASGCSINDFHGLFGYGVIPMWFALPLTVFAAVGIINAINLIDGVDGLSSGYCVMACMMFCVMFYRVGHVSMVILAAVGAGAVIPFFFHNVFGRDSKMFIGDGGTLLIGTLMATFVLQVLRTQSPAAQLYDGRIGLIPFTLAVLSIPVFDTLRVMTARILRGHSPFRPDKTHLHHIFLDLGFSHPAIFVAILTLNCSVVLAWWALAAYGYSINTQLYVVVALALFFTFGLYGFLAYHIANNTRFSLLMRRLAAATHVERKGFFLWLRQVVDRI